MEYEHWMLVVAILTIANIFWTLSLFMWGQGKVTIKKCESLRDECMGDRVKARETDSSAKVLAEIVKELRAELDQSKQDRKRLFVEVERAFSILGDLAMSVQILGAKVMKDEPDTMNVVLELIRKGKQEK